MSEFFPSGETWKRLVDEARDFAIEHAGSAGHKQELVKARAYESRVSEAKAGGLWLALHRMCQVKRGTDAYLQVRRHFYEIIEDADFEQPKGDSN